MGSSCNSTKYRCPIHKDQNIQTICLEQRCIEPLCHACQKDHRDKHYEVGTPPTFNNISVIVKQIQNSWSRECNKIAQIQQIPKQIRKISTVDVIKQFTREYFIQKMSLKSKNTEKPIINYIEAIQLSYFLDKSQNKQKIHNFIKSNLQANKEVISKQFRPLY